MRWLITKNITFLLQKNKKNEQQHVYKYLIFLCMVATLTDLKKNLLISIIYLAIRQSCFQDKNSGKHSQKISNIFLVDHRKTPNTRFSIETDGTFFFLFVYNKNNFLYLFQHIDSLVHDYVLKGKCSQTLIDIHYVHATSISSHQISTFIFLCLKCEKCNVDNVQKNKYMRITIPSFNSLTPKKGQVPYRSRDLQAN